MNTFTKKPKNIFSVLHQDGTERTKHKARVRIYIFVPAIDFAAQ